ncbi:MAG: OmpH family outer membrane protein [Muribaculaceae bacterium]|nr:OmpH family outer membrane protein [Muribaculaceae bacterium]MDE6119153.1 OmpH family outer membrane protein [Muribaculaceae bacterium]MDE6315286.1 OmpH family outer membrane protein [Muribaculaceae bacterium]
MKNLTFFAALLMMGFALALASCDSKPASDSAAGGNDSIDSSKDMLHETALAKYVRYVDMGRIQMEYSLFQEYAKADSVAQYTLAVEQQQHSARLNKRAEEIQNKYQQGLYLSQQSLESDQASLQKMQEAAAAQLDKKQIEFARQLGNMQSQINDSINSVVRYICQKNNVDAILNSAAGLYFNPALDITDEVLDELNKRYKPSGAAK